MRVLVCGDRRWEDWRLVYDTLDQLLVTSPIHLVSGGAKGADTCAERYARARDLPIEVFQAEWKLNGRAAGPIRNKRMLDEGRPDLVVAFHDDLENSKGTKHMVRIAQAARVPVKVVTHAVAGNAATTIQSVSLNSYQVIRGTSERPDAEPT